MKKMISSIFLCILIISLLEPIKGFKFNTVYASTIGGKEIRIYKSRKELELYSGEKLIEKFKIALSSSPIGRKIKQGDLKTPEGSYYICTKNPNSKYNKFLGVSYPNIPDGKNGLKTGLISQNDYNKILQSIEKGTPPPWDTPLGGWIGIHGGGITSDWTQGCIALSERDINALWSLVELNTPVHIYP